MFISALKSTGFAYNFFIFVNILFVNSAEVWTRQIFWRRISLRTVPEVV